METIRGNVEVVYDLVDMRSELSDPPKVEPEIGSITIWFGDRQSMEITASSDEHRKLEHLILQALDEKKRVELSDEGDRKRDEGKDKDE